MVTGLFGKLPAHGDFVRRDLPRSFVAPWDDWLSQGMEAARNALGEAWEAAWEAAPVWRFRLAPGICGPAAVVGVLATSRDMVGRRFPLTLAAILPGAAVPPPDEWYALLEAAALRARQGDMDAGALAATLPPVPADDPDATLDGRNLFWCAGLPGRSMPAPADFIRLLDGPAAPPPELAAAWRTAGPDAARPGGAEPAQDPSSHAEVARPAAAAPTAQLGAVPSTATGSTPRIAAGTAPAAASGTAGEAALACQAMAAENAATLPPGRATGGGGALP